MALFGPYVLGVELASMLLLAALVGARHLGRARSATSRRRRASMERAARRRPSRRVGAASRRGGRDRRAGRAVAEPDAGSGEGRRLMASRALRVRARAGGGPVRSRPGRACWCAATSSSCWPRIEIMLNAAGLAFVVAGARWGQADGQVMFIFILAMAAAEVAVGLASRCASASASARLDIDDADRDAGLTMLAPALAHPRCCPLAGFVVLALAGPAPRARRRRRRSAPAPSASRRSWRSPSAVDFIVSPPAGHAYHQVLWTWFDVAGFAPQIAFYLDAARRAHDAGRHLRRLPHPPLLHRVHERRRGLHAASSPT